jgi:hypothetical protein
MAEVKVRVTAQNEVRTGLQQALAETKQFGNEASRAVAIDDEAALEPLRRIQQQLRDIRSEAQRPISQGEIVAASGGGGDEFASTSQRGSAAIRGLAIDLANASSPAQVFEAIIRRISTAMGGLIAATAGFAIGSLIRRNIEEAAQGLNNLIDQGEQLSQTLSTLTAPTTSFDQFASTLNSVRSQIEGLQKATDDYKSSISTIATDLALTSGPAERIAGLFGPQAALAGKLADRLTGQQGNLANAADANAESKIAEARLSVRAGIAQQLANELAISKELSEEGRRQLASDQQRAKQRNDLQKLLVELQSPAEETGARLAEFDRVTEEQRRRQEEDRARAESGTRIGNVVGRQLGPGDFGGAKEFERQQEAAARASAQQAEEAKRSAASLSALQRSVQTPDERRAALETEQAALAQRAASLAPDDFAGRADVVSEAQRIASELRGLQDAGATGSAGASAFQRIGFASNEFFDTRKQDDSPKNIEEIKKFVTQIVSALNKAEPLVLPSTSS